MRPFFSVIIPLYNKAHFIRKTLLSVISQTFKDFEVIVIDDGSTDGSVAKVGTVVDSRITCHTKENGGVSSARNMGIALAQGDYIAFLDADDVWHETYLNTIYNNIRLFPQERVFSCAIEFEHEGRITNALYSFEVQEVATTVDYFEGSLCQSVLSGSSTVVHKSVFEKVGVFDETVKRGEDTDMWVRIGIFFRVVFDPQVLVSYTYHAESLSRQGNNIIDSANFDGYQEAEFQRPAMKKFLDYNRFSLAIKSKLLGDMAMFRHFHSRISPHSLPLRKKILLRLSPSLLKGLIRIKNLMMRAGLTRSVFVE